MDIGSEDKLLILELHNLTDEAMKRSQSVSKDSYQPRRLFALAQVMVCQKLMEYLVDNEEWEDFGEILEDSLENEESRYQEACDANDRQTMNIVLANRRALRRLIRRLTDPRRRQQIMSQVEEAADSNGAGTKEPALPT